MSNRKKNSWFCSSAAIATYCLFGANIILIAIGLVILYIYGDWDVPNYVLNLIVGLSTNLLGIIVTIGFVQHFLNKQSQKDEKERETAKIKRFDRIIKIKLERYALFFFCITTPINSRKNIKNLPIGMQFNINDMYDMYSSSLFLTENIMGAAIEAFYKAENDLCQCITNTIENIDFNYHPQIKECLLSFIETSIGDDVKGAILGNTKTFAGDKKLSDIAMQELKDHSKNWEKMGDTHQLNSHIMLPYYKLYKMLKYEAELLNQYIEHVSKL